MRPSAQARSRSSTGRSWSECNPRALTSGRKTANARATYFDLDDSARIPVIAEPLFQQLGATVEFIPVMNAEELQRGLAEIAKG